MALAFLVTGTFSLFFFGSIGLLLLRMYNALVENRNRAELAWSNIDVALKQRFDEIPQLIKVIEHYVQYEKNIISELLRARSNYGLAGSINDKIEAAKLLSIAFDGAMAIGEAYPDLKSSEHFSQLQSRISNLEARIADRRETYNESVAIYNTRIAQFPEIIFARLFTYEPLVLFDVAEIEKERAHLRGSIERDDVA